MAIEFRCTHCNKLLTVGDESAGKMARCPQCGATASIPAAPSDEADDAAVSAPPPPPNEANPYQSPAGTAVQFAEERHHDFRPSPIDFELVFSRAWTIYKDNFGLCVGVGIVALLLSALVGGTIPVAGERMRFPEQSIVNLLTAAIWLWLVFGHLYFSLKLARGQDASLADLFSAGPFFLVGVAVWLFTVVVSCVGLALLIVPGVILWLMLSPSIFVAMDQRTGVVESLRLSIEATRSNKLTLFAIWVVAICGGGLLGVLTCGLGFLLVHPFVFLLYAVTYLSMTGQPIGSGHGALSERRFDAPPLGGSTATPAP